MSREGFEPFAEWWDRAVGEEGDFFHLHLVRPALFHVLGDVAGLEVLDLACGNGSSTRWLARAGARCVGVDASPTLVARARAYEAAEPFGIDYLVADAASVPLPGASVDRVVCNMALMDIEDGAGAIREVGRLLRPGGRFVASLFHPCFEVGNYSSWLIELVELEERISRRVWRYRDVFGDLGVAKPDQPQPHTYYHRPLGWYVERLVEAGLFVDALDEPLPDAAYQERWPDSYRRQQVTPSILVIGARKVG